MNTKNTALIVILDEIDFLRSEDVLYNFSRAVANEELKEGDLLELLDYLTVLSTKLDLTIELSLQWVPKK